MDPDNRREDILTNYDKHINSSKRKLTEKKFDWNFFEIITRTIDKIHLFYVDERKRLSLTNCSDKIWINCINCSFKYARRISLYVIDVVTE